MHLHGREAAGELVYERHRPEDTRLYRLVEQHYPEFVAHLAEQGKDLPAYVEKEFEAHLECGWLEHDFFVGALQALPLRAPDCFQLQEAWILPELWRAAHGGNCRAAGRRGFILPLLKQVLARS